MHLSVILLNIKKNQNILTSKDNQETCLYFHPINKSRGELNLIANFKVKYMLLRNM